MTRARMGWAVLMLATWTARITEELPAGQR